MGEWLPKFGVSSEPGTYQRMRLSVQPATGRWIIQNISIFSPPLHFATNPLITEVDSNANIYLNPRQKNSFSIRLPQTKKTFFTLNVVGAFQGKEVPPSLMALPRPPSRESFFFFLSWQGEKFKEFRAKGFVEVYKYKQRKMGI